MTLRKARFAAAATAALLLSPATAAQLTIGFSQIGSEQQGMIAIARRSVASSGARS
jgi:hypothetical protein